MRSFDGADYTGSSTSLGRRDNFQVSGRAFIMESPFFEGAGNGNNSNNTNADYIAGGTLAAER